MSAILGFTKRDENLLNTMASKLRHRGCRLSRLSDFKNISMVSVSHNSEDSTNPCRYAAGFINKIFVVLEGFIYNEKEIADKLTRKGHHLKTLGLAELMLHAFEESIDHFAPQFNGAFTAAIWDARNNTLTLIRDRIGQKMLYYHYDGKNIFFASEIKALFAVNSIRKVLRYDSISHYLTFGYVPSPHTLFEGINKVPAGTIVTYSSMNLIGSRRYWRIQFSENPSYDIAYVSDTVLQHLRRSVISRLDIRPNEVKGFLISGGLDSSTILEIAHEYTSQPIRTFTLSYDGEYQNKPDDTRYSRMLATLFKTKHQNIVINCLDMLTNMKEIIRGFDEPFPGVISNYFLTRNAQKSVSTLLSGDGGDEIFGSYTSHRLAQPMRNMRELSDWSVLTEKRTQELLSPYDDQINYLKSIYNPNVWSWISKLYTFDDSEKNMLYSERFRRNLSNVRSVDMLRSYLSDSTTKDPLNQILELDFNTLLPDKMLLYVDRMSAVNSVETIAPFLDNELIDFMATVPGSMKIFRGITKYILKKAMSNKLPVNIVRRSKEGFMLPIRDWMKGPLRDAVIDILSPNRLAIHGFFEKRYIELLIRRYYSTECEHELKKHANKLWALMTFQLWYEMYFG